LVSSRQVPTLNDPCCHATPRGKRNGLQVLHCGTTGTSVAGQRGPHGVDRRTRQLGPRRMAPRRCRPRRPCSRQQRTFQAYTRPQCSRQSRPAAPGPAAPGPAALGPAAPSPAAPGPAAAGPAAPGPAAAGPVAPGPAAPGPAAPGPATAGPAATDPPRLTPPPRTPAPSTCLHVRLRRRHGALKAESAPALVMAVRRAAAVAVAGTGHGIPVGRREGGCIGYREASASPQTARGIGCALERVQHLARRSFWGGMERTCGRGSGEGGRRGLWVGPTGGAQL